MYKEACLVAELYFMENLNLSFAEKRWSIIRILREPFDIPLHFGDPLLAP